MGLCVPLRMSFTVLLAVLGDFMTMNFAAGEYEETCFRMARPLPDDPLAMLSLGPPDSTTFESSVFLTSSSHREIPGAVLGLGKYGARNPQKSYLPMHLRLT